MKWQPTLVFLPGKSRGQRSLEGYSAWGHKSAGHDLVTKTTTNLDPHRQRQAMHSSHMVVK